MIQIKISTNMPLILSRLIPLGPHLLCFQIEGWGKKGRVFTLGHHLERTDSKSINYKVLLENDLSPKFDSWPVPGLITTIQAFKAKQNAVQTRTYKRTAPRVHRIMQCSQLSKSEMISLFSNCRNSTIRRKLFSEMLNFVKTLLKKIPKAIMHILPTLPNK